jgi:hypothetical protein
MTSLACTSPSSSMNCEWKGMLTDGVLYRGGVAVVVLGRHDHERVSGVDDLAPVPGVLMQIVAQARMVGLVEEREVDLRQVGHLNIEYSMGPGACNEPLGDGRPARPGRVEPMMTVSVGMAIRLR